MGAEHLLTGVTVKPIADKGGAKLPALDFPIEFDFGSVGTTASDLEKRLGKTVL